MIRKLIVSACAAAMSAGIGAAPALAQQTLDARTEFTFNGPVDLPGTTLPPGNYIFRLADPNTSRKVLQVTANDSTHKTYGLFITISAQRPTPSDKAELRFMETPAGTPRAVKTWWYPGDTIGREFIYPKDQARRLAKETNTAVLTTAEENVKEDQMNTAKLSRISPSGEETEVDEEVTQSAANTAPVNDHVSPQANQRPTGTAGMTSGANRTTADNPAANQSASDRTMARTSLPRTGSMLPLLAVIGSICLAAGALVGFRRAGSLGR